MNLVDYRLDVDAASLLCVSLFQKLLRDGFSERDAARRVDNIMGYSREDKGNEEGQEWQRAEQEMTGYPEQWRRT